jgi:hypothetical protein
MGFRVHGVQGSGFMGFRGFRFSVDEPVNI